MNTNELSSGILTGIISGIIFNPIDKAIYLSTTKNLKITNKSIWRELYKGFEISILTRLINSGLYFSYIDYHSSISSSILSTSLILSTSCTITNPLQLIKFMSWYNNISIIDTCHFIKNKYGYRGYLIGASSLFIRDLVFNYIYLSLKKKEDHINNICVVSLGLIIVSPLNLVKNKKYGSNESLRSIISNFKFSQLGISYSLLRMSVGFYMSQYIYDFIKNSYK